MKNNLLRELPLMNANQNGLQFLTTKHTKHTKAAVFFVSFVYFVVCQFLQAASTTEVNVSNLPHATSLSSTNLVLVLTNATKARLATVQQIVDLGAVWTNDAGRISIVATNNDATVLINPNAAEGSAAWQSLTSVRDISAGDSAVNGFYFAAYSDPGLSYLSEIVGRIIRTDPNDPLVFFSVTATATNAISSGVELYAEPGASAIFIQDFSAAIGNRTPTQLNPAEPDPYVFSTTYTATNGQYLARFANNGTNRFTVDYSGNASAGGGVSSSATDAAVSIAATGWTNTYGKNATVYFDGGQITFKVFNGAGTAVYTNAIAVTNATVILQPAGKVTISGNSVTGRATPF